MKIQQKDKFHGAALTQIVEHPQFKALNKGTPKYGLYHLDNDKTVFVKYTAKTGSPWQFVFHPPDFPPIVKELVNRRVFFCLVYPESICLLDADELKQLVDLNAHQEQWIRVEVNGPGASMRVRGSRGALGHAVAHNSFPQKLFN